MRVFRRFRYGMGEAWVPPNWVEITDKIIKTIKKIGEKFFDENGNINEEVLRKHLQFREIEVKNEKIIVADIDAVISVIPKGRPKITTDMRKRTEKLPTKRWKVEEIEKGDFVVGTVFDDLEKGDIVTGGKVKKMLRSLAYFLDQSYKDEPGMLYGYEEAEEKLEYSISPEKVEITTQYKYYDFWASEYICLKRISEK